MKAVLRSIKPYWFYLICEGKKTIEIGKSSPQSADWNSVVELYSSKDKKSFNRIPKEFQEKYSKYLGKVAARFVCDKVEQFTVGSFGCDDIQQHACLSYGKLIDYFYKQDGSEDLEVKFGYAWHISNLKIYDKPKELSEFRKPCICEGEYEGEKYCDCLSCELSGDSDYGVVACDRHLTRPPQSWQYVAELK